MAFYGFIQSPQTMLNAWAMQPSVPAVHGAYNNVMLQSGAYVPSQPMVPAFTPTSGFMAQPMLTGYGNYYNLAQSYPSAPPPERTAAPARPATPVAPQNAGNHTSGPDNQLGRSGPTAPWDRTASETAVGFTSLASQSETVTSLGENSASPSPSPTSVTDPHGLRRPLSPARKPSPPFPRPGDSRLVDVPLGATRPATAEGVWTAHLMPTGAKPSPQTAAGDGRKAGDPAQPPSRAPAAAPPTGWRVPALALAPLQPPQAAAAGRPSGLSPTADAQPLVPVNAPTHVHPARRLSPTTVHEDGHVSGLAGSSLVGVLRNFQFGTSPPRRQSMAKKVTLPPMAAAQRLALDDSEPLSARLARQFGLRRDDDGGASHHEGSPGHDTPSDSESEEEEAGKTLPRRATVFYETGSLAAGGGVSLDDFELLRVLGQGAFGKAWKVRHRKTHRLYAMKVMSKRLFQQQHIVDLLKAEQAVLASVKHPFLVSLRWAWQTSSRAFLVMDYIPGGELSKHLFQSPGGRFPEHQARFYTAQIVLAYEHLHSRHIIYRDMKPDNIVLDEAGNALLIDFGLARPLRDPAAQDRGGRYFGLPNYYLSPEMIRGEPFGLEVDFWMLGVVVFQMLTGRLPWMGRDPAVVHAEIASDRPVEVPAGWGLSSDAVNFLQRLLAKRRPFRLTSAAAVKAHPWLSDMPWDKLLRKELSPPFRPPPQPEDAEDPDANCLLPAHLRKLSYCRAPSMDLWLDEFNFCRGQSQVVEEE